MGQKFIPKGPKRYKHQTRGLMKMIATGGVTALLFDPGTGKTMTALDYVSLLALKSIPDEAGVREVRVLVAAPLAAVDTWVDQAEKYVTDDVQLWAEALSGSTRQKAEALAARGNNPFKKESRTRIKHGKRGIHFEKSIMIRSRGDLPHGHQADGPDCLGVERPRLIIEVVNLDMFSQRQQVGSTSMTAADVVYDAVKRYKPDIVIVDESHKIKSATSNVSRMLARIGRLVDRRVILTGTVMPAGPLDVYGQWRFLEPFAFGDVTADGQKKTATFDGFRRRFAEMGGWSGQQVVGFKNLDELQKIMGINAEVAKKADALDLPKALPAIVRVDLGPAERKAYDEMKKGLAIKLASGMHSSSKNRLSQMMRLRQITSGYVPDDNKNVHVLGDSKTKMIRSLVYDTLAGEQRVVVFALFLYEIEMLRKQLIANTRAGEPATELMVISGETHPDERLRLRRRFGDINSKDADGNPVRIVMVAQVRTMSLSVNELVTAQNAIFGSLPTDRSDFIQSQDRLDRIGQDGGSLNKVTFWFALVPGSIDEVIYKAHLTRTNLETAVLRHIYDGDVPAELSAAQAARRDEDEQDHQVGRLIKDEAGNVTRHYGDATEVVKVAEPKPEDSKDDDPEAHNAKMASQLQKRIQGA